MTVQPLGEYPEGVFRSGGQTYETPQRPPVSMPHPRNHRYLVVENALLRSQLASAIAERDLARAERDNANMRATGNRP